MTKVGHSPTRCVAQSPREGERLSLTTPAFQLGGLSREMSRIVWEEKETLLSIGEQAIMRPTRRTDTAARTHGQAIYSGCFSGERRRRRRKGKR